MWTEVATYRKYFRKSKQLKIWDTFRVYVNSLGWVKSHSDKTGKTVYYKSVEELQDRIKALHKIKYSLISGELPATVVAQ